MSKQEQISATDSRRLAPSPSVRRFGREIVCAAGEHAILDVACGGGRNSAWIAYLGGRVIGIDIDLRRINGECEKFSNTALGKAFKRFELLKMDLIQEVWPYPPSSIGGIVNIHFLEHSLLRPFGIVNLTMPT
jgi:2-polyprenyl-3-methyl-5-hydroxy-6-metoxy-1,4-benzoquinol methylase